MQIRGKTALITGASRGIGRAIALELARAGVTRLILVARNQPRLAEVAAEVQRLNPQVEVVPLAVELSQTAAIDPVISRAWEDYGPIHLLVNSAGVAYQRSFLQSKLQQVQEEINVNLLGMYAITRLVARRMVIQREGVIVNVSSLMGKLAAPTMATYSATKFAILGFTQALRLELAPYNVRAIALLPTLTDTDMVRDLRWFRWVWPITPEQVAKALVAGLHKESIEILVGWQSKVAVLLNRLIPWLAEKVLSLSAPQSGSCPAPQPLTLRSKLGRAECYGWC
ncbi:SDR family NAD(P)-dependent oxidoreductase [Chroococcidiopsis sp. CCMEE 29]|uniref:SDR family NAD(P)-dependent oxidoreductase n=1 Tax=Chroococcidiopsis sp. CCMEE 29 TaxID=155894 RepID=UPI0020208A95|nr:SDR family NAD(P)-dependent oxidoreductase [Chroococcidiopsis sp. CCMEE 29]